MGGKGSVGRSLRGGTGRGKNRNRTNRPAQPPPRRQNREFGRRRRAGKSRARDAKGPIGCLRGTYRGGEDAEVGLGHDDGARLEGGGGASAELHLRDRSYYRGEKSVSTTVSSTRTRAWTTRRET